ncbi:MAG: hypothetical protein PHW60_12165 [Kiritimatiellae bacterium]|nr:hypothetical protein [Kiritimatiellia bacterium]
MEQLRKVAGRGILIVLLLWTWEASAIKVGLFKDGRPLALDELAKTLTVEGIETEIFTSADVSKGNIYRYDVLYFGGGWNAYDWLDLNGRMHIVEFVQNRGGGVIFSMFRCGWAARLMRTKSSLLIGNKRKVGACKG